MRNVLWSFGIKFKLHKSHAFNSARSVGRLWIRAARQQSVDYFIHGDCWYQNRDMHRDTLSVRVIEIVSMGSKDWQNSLIRMTLMHFRVVRKAFPDFVLKADENDENLWKSNKTISLFPISWLRPNSTSWNHLQVTRQHQLWPKLLGHTQLAPAEVTPESSKLLK